jgi:hypothetical protein
LNYSYTPEDYTPMMTLDISIFNGKGLGYLGQAGDGVDTLLPLPVLHGERGGVRGSHGTNRADS